MKSYRIDPSKGMEIGLYSVGDYFRDPHTGTMISPQRRMQEFVEAAKLAEQAGLDVFSVGESHQEHFVTQAHTVVLSAVAQATRRIKIASSTTVLSVLDPVRAYEDFATIDLLSGGRAEIIAGRGSRVGAYELLGADVQDYEELFEEKMGLLLKLNDEETVTWSGKFRAPLRQAKILPRPLNGRLPIWRGVGGSPGSAVKAGAAGVPMTIAMLGGPSANFKGSVDAYRRAAAQNGHDPAELPVGITSMLYVAENSQDAVKEFHPHLNLAFRALRGGSYPLEAVSHAAADPGEALMVGSPELVIEKILRQHELFGHQRLLVQTDVGGVPFGKLAKNIELIAARILPAVRKYTRAGGKA
ncbi:LLM class flavin-dependent oxidoreductase [Paenibacillus sp. MWE-103]|uniref:LLM class flavin-dependent oxidoreductase n=1 Tax=Paenibacillus artemisiicola TaxID=1172618 RepID=A0ABS3WEE9_9BACL|nr:LLM class flavin-dependent oxidoreductase [Paenibacillus artemisiicola]MBO7746687.1 LLM class flavin-dependent oxidoreductase [Paenibacillus artemisiicola]